MSSLTDELIFDDLTPIEVPVKIKGERYVLKEALEDHAVKFRNMAIKAARMADGKVVGVDGVADTEPFLVSCCLFKVTTQDPSLGGPICTPISLATIKGWPSRIVKKLFERAKAISDLSEDGDDPTAKALTVALSRDDSPILLAKFREWVDSLPDEKLLAPLRKAVKPGKDELLKNALNAGAAISA